MYIQGRLFNTSSAKYCPRCSTSSHYLCWDGNWNLMYFMKFDSCFWKKWHGVDHKGLLYAIWSSSTHPYTSKEGYETVKQQCMSLVAVQQPIFPFWEGAQHLIFCMKLRLVFVRNDMVFSTRGTYMLMKAPPILITHLSKIMTHWYINLYLLL